MPDSDVTKIYPTTLNELYGCLLALGCIVCSGTAQLLRLHLVPTNRISEVIMGYAFLSLNGMLTCVQFTCPGVAQPCRDLGPLEGCSITWREQTEKRRIHLNDLRA